MQIQFRFFEPWERPVAHPRQQRSPEPLRILQKAQLVFILFVELESCQTLTRSQRSFDVRRERLPLGPVVRVPLQRLQLLLA